MRLTRSEVLILTFLLVAFCLGAATRHYRHTHPEPTKATPAPRR